MLFTLFPVLAWESPPSSPWKPASVAVVVKGGARGRSSSSGLQKFPGGEQSLSPRHLSFPLFGCLPFPLFFRAPNHILEAALLHRPQWSLRTRRPGERAAPRGLSPLHPRPTPRCADWPLLGHPPAEGRQGPVPSGKFSESGGSWTFGDSQTAAPEAAGVWAAMEEPPLREEEGEEEEEEGDEAGPEGALRKSPFQLNVEDVYDISYVVGRELMALGSDPRVTQLQFKIVRVLEMLETLVNEGNLAVEELRMERDNLRKEVERLRREGSAATREVSAGRGGLGPEQPEIRGGAPTGREAPFLSPT